MNIIYNQLLNKNMNKGSELHNFFLFSLMNKWTELTFFLFLSFFFLNFDKQENLLKV